MTILPLLAILAVWRLAELVLAARNTRRLRALGAVELSPGHYPLLVALHGGWFAALALTIPNDRPGQLWGLILLALLMALRLWVITSLGPLWTTRIITLPHRPLVRLGPYRWMRHPNYAVVAGELAVVPLAYGAWRAALVFTLLNGAILAWRIHCEEQALAPRRSL